MRSNRKLALGAAFLLAALVFWGILNSISNRNASTNTENASTVANAAAAPTPIPSGRIVRANQNIPAGSIIAPGMFEMAAPPSGVSSTGFITDPDKDALGYITREPIRKGAYVRPEQFVGHITEVGIAGALRPGMRAMVVPISNKPTLHDLVRIGNYVDVFAAFDGQESRAVIQNVRVLAVDVQANDFPVVNAGMRGGYKAENKGKIPPGDVPPPPGVAPTPTPAPQTPPPAPTPALTVEVTPAQAAALLLVQASGANFDFILRPAFPGGAETLVAGAAPATEDLTPVSVTRAQVSPYTERQKRLASAPAPAPREPRAPRSFPQLPSPVPAGPSPAIPVPMPQPAPPATYDIPIYADGKMVRTDTVRRPE